MINRQRGAGSGGAITWFAQRVSGAILLFALLVHFWVLHFFPVDPHGEITYQIVMERLQHPLWRTFNMIFLISGILHGMSGVVLNVHDYVSNPKVRVAIVGALWVGAAFFLVIGSMTMLGIAGKTGL